MEEWYWPPALPSSTEESDSETWDDYDPSWDPWANELTSRQSSAVPAPSALADEYELSNALNAFGLAQEKWMKSHNADLTNAVPRKMSPTGLKRPHQTYLGLPTAIFIHAGAGFHSIQNEKFHLSVCSEYVFSMPQPDLTR